MEEAKDDFYIWYYVGHKGKYGHEFLEFEVTSEGRLRYANNSNYKKDELIWKEVYVNTIVLDELKWIVSESTVLECSDKKWN